MERRSALRAVALGAAAILLPRSQSAGTGGLLRLPPASSLSLSIDDPRFTALRSVGGTVEISNLIVPGIQSVLPGAFPLALVRVDNAIVSALGKECPHNQCQVGSFNGEKFICPCHDSEFDAAGGLLAGPATRGLDSFPAVLVGSLLTVDGMPGDTLWNLTSVRAPTIPTNLELYPVYPQPVRHTMTVRWRQDVRSHVILCLLDMSGRLLRTIIDAEIAPGAHEYVVNTADLSSGVYELVLASGRYVEQRHVVVTR
jgi:nitrite reductase/ring-hydroxylating ferredoxin subunit